MHTTLLKHHNCIKLKYTQNSLLMQSTVVSGIKRPKCFVTLLYACRRWIYVLLWLICVSWRFCFLQMLCGTFDKSKIFSMIFWIQIGYNWIQVGYRKIKSIKKTVKVQEILDTKCIQKWLRLVVVLIPWIQKEYYLLNRSGRYVSGRLRLWSRWG